MPDNGRVIALPRKDGALYEAGFRDQQILVSVDNRDVSSESFADIGARLTSAARNGAVWLELRQTPNTPIQRVRLVSATTRRLPVEVVKVNGHDVVRIHAFVARQTRELLMSALKELDHASNRLILDLRYAGGGDLFEAMDCASLFLPAGKRLATVVDRDGARQEYHSLENMQVVRRPVMLLVGPGTASASEVFLRALEHYRRAYSVGAKTHGKCLSQRQYVLPDGSVLSLSNRRILGPDDRYCEGQGVMPDLSVEDDMLGDTLALIRRGTEAMTQRPDLTNG